MKRLVLIICLILAASPAMIFSDDAQPYYDQGTQNFTFALGPRFPLFVLFPSDWEFLTGKFDPLGITGSIGWEMFVSENQAFGIEMGYGANQVVDGERFFSVPLLATYRMYPLSSSAVDFPLTLKGGFSYSRMNALEDQINLDFAFAPSAGILWRSLPAWSFGLETSWWVLPEWYIRNEPERTGIGNFFSITLTATYTNR